MYNYIAGTALQLSSNNFSLTLHLNYFNAFSFRCKDVPVGAQSVEWFSPSCPISARCTKHPWCLFLMDKRTGFINIYCYIKNIFYILSQLNLFKLVSFYDPFYKYWCQNDSNSHFYLSYIPLNRLRWIAFYQHLCLLSNQVDAGIHAS